MTRRGRFIVVEGIDGSGSTTQAERLVARLRAQGITALQTHEPTPGCVGRLLRQVLQGDVLLPSGGGGAGGTDQALNWQTMALLFAADRMDHNLGLIRPALDAGTWVVSDRYVLSSLAYQAITSGQGRKAVPWLTELNREVTAPDLTIVLAVSAQIAEARRRRRAQAEELYETLALQEQLAAWYSDAHRLLGEEHRVTYVDGETEVEPCADAIWDALAVLLE